RGARRRARCLGGRRRPGDRPQRAARPLPARRHARRAHPRRGLGLRAAAARRGDPRAGAGDARAQVRSRAPAGAGRRASAGDPAGAAPRYPGDADARRRDRRRDRGSGAAGADRAGPPQRPRLAGASDTVLLARKCGICRAFFMAETSYTAKDITVLEGLEPVRLRPGMYIGSTGLRGLHHLVYEVVDNSVDEALAGFNERIEVTLHPDHSVTVTDWGSGIPVDTVEGQGESALTV